MNKLFKRIGSLMLAFLLVLGLFPGTNLRVNAQGNSENISGPAISTQAVSEDPIEYVVAARVKNAQMVGDIYSLGMGLEYEMEASVTANSQTVSDSEVVWTSSDSSKVAVSGSSILALAKTNEAVTVKATYVNNENPYETEIKVIVRDQIVHASLIDLETNQVIDLINNDNKYDVFAGKEYKVTATLEGAALDDGAYTISDCVGCVNTDGKIYIPTDLEEGSTSSFVIKSTVYPGSKQKVLLRVHRDAYVNAFLQGATQDEDGYFRIQKTTAKAQKSYNVQYKIVAPNGTTQTITNPNVSLEVVSGAAFISTTNSTTTKSATVTPKDAGKSEIVVTVSADGFEAKTIASAPLKVRVFDSTEVKSIEFGAVKDGVVTSLKGLSKNDQKLLKEKMTSWALGTEKNENGSVDKDLAIIVKDKNNNTMPLDKAGVVLSFKLSNKKLEKNTYTKNETTYKYKNNFSVKIDDRNNLNGSAVRLDCVNEEDMRGFASFNLTITATTANGKKASYTVKVNNSYVESMPCNPTIYLGATANATIKMGVGYTASDRANAAKMVSGTAVSGIEANKVLSAAEAKAQKLTGAQKKECIIYTPTKTGVKYTAGKNVAAGAKFSLGYNYADGTGKNLGIITVTEKTAAKTIDIYAKVMTDSTGYGTENKYTAAGRMLSPAEVKYKYYNAKALITVKNTAVGGESVAFKPKATYARGWYNLKSYYNDKGELVPNTFEVEFYNRYAAKVPLTFIAMDGSKAKATIYFKLDNTMTQAYVSDGYENNTEAISVGGAAQNAKVLHLAKGKSMKLSTYLAVMDMKNLYKTKITIKGDKIVYEPVDIHGNVSLSTSTINAKKAEVSDNIIIRAYVARKNAYKEYEKVEGTEEKYYKILITKPVEAIPTFAVSSGHARVVAINGRNYSVEATDTTLNYVIPSKVNPKADTYRAQFVANATNKAALAYDLPAELRDYGDYRISVSGASDWSANYDQKVVYVQAKKPGTVKITFTTKEGSGFKKVVTIKYN